MSLDLGFRTSLQTTLGKKIADQLTRSTMSVGANYEEARGAEGKADFCHKLQIAFKEMRETRYWILLIAKAKLVDSGRLDPLVDEATLLRSILAKAVATARGKARGSAGVESETEQAIISRIRELRGSGKSLREIANLLNSKDVSTKNGGRWQANTVRKVLNFFSKQGAGAEDSLAVDIY